MTSLLRIQKLHYPPPVRHGKIYCFFIGLVKGSKKHHSKKHVTPDSVRQIEDSGSIEYLRGVFMSQPNICDQDFWQKRLLELFIEVKHVFTWVSPLSTNFRKWSNALKQFVGKLPTNCLSVFGHFVGLALKGLKYSMSSMNHHLFSQKIRINLEHSEAQNLEKIKPLSLIKILLALV